MAGHFDLRHDCNEPRTRVVDDLLDLRLRIVASDVRIGILFSWNRALETDFGQAGIFLDFETPALVICEMPMESVELILRHQVEYFLDFGDRKKVPPDIEQDPAIVKSRIILNFNRWQRDRWIQV